MDESKESEENHVSGKDEKVELPQGSINDLLGRADFSKLNSLQPDPNTPEGRYELAHSEIEAYDREGRRIANQSGRQELALRKKFSKRIPKLVTWYLVFVGTVLFLSGLQFHGKIPDSLALYIGFQFKLSDQVLIALLTTTTITVLGLYHTVARHVFPSKTK